MTARLPKVSLEIGGGLRHRTAGMRADDLAVYRVDLSYRAPFCIAASVQNGFLHLQHPADDPPAARTRSVLG